MDQLVEDHDPAEVYTTQFVGGRERYRQRFLPAAQIVRGEGSERSIWIVPTEQPTGVSWRSNAHVGSCVPGETAIEAAYKANQHFVQRELVPEMKQIRSYIRWQQGRAANWEPKPLQEIAA